jgi:serine protease
MTIRRLLRPGGIIAATVAGVVALGAPTAGAKPILMLNALKQAQKQQAIWQQHTFAPVGALQPPAPPCPENGMLPAPFSNCGLPEAPATTLPYPGNMAYWGGHVQTNPKIYLVYWGWGEPGAFPGQTCSSESISEGSLSATLGCDPDGAGKYMANFVQQIGGTAWANLQNQYYQSGSSGTQTHINEGGDLLAGMWADDSNDITGLAKTSASNPPGATNTYTDLAAEAARAVQYFESTGQLSASDLPNADIMVLQPPAYSDPNALSQGYCAFHDWAASGFEGGLYNGLPVENFAWSNIPYQLAINSNGVNVCGENAVNTDAAGKLDGFSIVLGHEAQETITDPGAEDISGSGLSTTNLGGWYDAADANENGDKCAWVGENLLTATGPPEPIPGALGDIQGNAGGRFAVQSLWSNDAAAGAGYCGGVNDLGF